MGRVAGYALLLGGLVCACAVPAADGRGGSRSLLPEVRIAGALLDPRAFAAEAAFLFPEEARELTRSLLRAEFASREAERLGLAADPARLAQEVSAFEDRLHAELDPEGDFEIWAQQRYGRSWAEVRRVLVEHIARNQLYQICVRVEGRELPRVRMHWLVTSDSEEAEDWARQLRSGADPRAFLAASRMTGHEPDGSFAPMAARLPRPHEDALAEARAGTVVGPLRFEGDRSWWVGRVAAVEDPSRAVPPVQDILAELDQRPIEALEGRTWFEAMLRRYTANEGAISITAPVPAFAPDLGFPTLATPPR